MTITIKQLHADLSNVYKGMNADNIDYKRVSMKANLAGKLLTISKLHVHTALKLNLVPSVEHSGLEVNQPTIASIKKPRGPAANSSNLKKRA